MARILIIEDSPENLELMRYLIQAFGHMALLATDGAQGIEVARCEAPDLIVCDIHLPKMDGYEVARQVKRNPLLRSIPLVAVTALAMVGDRDKVLAAGFDGYIAKPIVPKRFVEQIEGYLGTPAYGRPAPAAAAAAAPAPAPAPAPALAATLWQHPHAQVLVVDDSPPNRELIGQALGSAAYGMRMVGSVHEGLALAREQVPDLILSDLHMPGADGFDFIRQAKADARLAAVPFLILTASLWSERDRDTAQRLGAVRFLTRPITPQALLKELAAVLPPRKESADGDRPGS